MCHWKGKKHDHFCFTRRKRRYGCMGSNGRYFGPYSCIPLLECAGNTSPTFPHFALPYYCVRRGERNRWISTLRETSGGTSRCLFPTPGRGSPTSGTILCEREGLHPIPEGGGHARFLCIIYGTPSHYSKTSLYCYNIFASAGWEVAALVRMRGHPDL